MGYRDVPLPLPRRDATARHVVIHEISLPRLGEMEFSEDIAVAQQLNMRM